MTHTPQDPFAHNCGRGPDELLRPVLASLADLGDLPSETWTAQHLAVADNIGMRLGHVFLHTAVALTPPGMVHDTVPRVSIGNGFPTAWLQTASTVWWLSAQRNGLAGLLANPLPWAAPATITAAASPLAPTRWSTMVDLTSDRLLAIAGLPITGELAAPRQVDLEAAVVRLQAWMNEQLAASSPAALSVDQVLQPGQVTQYSWDAVAVAGALTFRAVVMAHTMATLHGQVSAAPPRIPLTADFHVPWPGVDGDTVTFDLYSTTTSDVSTAGLGDK